MNLCWAGLYNEIIQQGVIRVRFVLQGELLREIFALVLDFNDFVQVQAGPRFSTGFRWL